MVVSYFDYFIILLVSCLTIVNWKYPPAWRISYVGELLVFGLLLPLLSIELEFRCYAPKSAETFDAFTMAYTLLKFPLYWGLFSLRQLVVFLKRQ
ncbi:hypothetical protein A8B98_20180 [Hymenobacter sp. UV11]|nr:hypothetical protein A8B98_20180 [Hymenobacter sp. UV11]